MPNDYNFDEMTNTLRKVLTQHNIGNTEEIIRDYERQQAQSWQARGVQPDQFNQIFTEKGKSAQAGNR